MDNAQVTKDPREEFEVGYVARSSWPVEFGKSHISMPCTCEDGGGPTHWAAIINTPEMIALHTEHEECLTDLRKMEV